MSNRQVRRHPERNPVHVNGGTATPPAEPIAMSGVQLAILELAETFEWPKVQIATSDSVTQFGGDAGAWLQWARQAMPPDLIKCLQMFVNAAAEQMGIRQQQRPRLWTPGEPL